MKISKIFGWAAIAVFAGLHATSCSDDKTYSELLNDESRYVNKFLADHRVVNEIQADTIFETGKDAPYYRIDEDGNLYMQVIDAGTPGNKVEDNEMLYFRFTRYDLSAYKDGQLTSSEGNDDVLGGNYSFRYGNYELSSSYSYGMGIQMPLKYLPVDCQVNLIVKSQMGRPSEMSVVIPFLYNLRYFRPKI